MSSAAIITGIGLVTPLGCTAQQTWDTLLDGRFISNHAKVPLEFAGDMPRISHLAIRAAGEAVREWPSTTVRTAALVIGTSKGSVERWLRPPARLSDVEGRLDFGLSEAGSDVASALGLDGPRLTVSTACASGLHALIRGALMIQTGEARRVLVVAAESSVYPMFIESFRRLGIIAGEEIGCRPFDQFRQGFLMSEAAAAVCLERADTGVNGITVEQFAMAADATHLTGMSPDAEPLARALREVTCDDPVDLFHAHATATAQHDAIELRVLERLAEEQPVPPHVYSHKGALGHSLGAAGLVSVVINVLSHRHGMVPPNVQTRNPLPTTNLRLSRQAERRKIHRSVAVAAGFGGQIAAISLRSG